MEKILHQKLEPYRYKLSLKTLNWLDKYKTRQNDTNSEMYMLKKRAQ